MIVCHCNVLTHQQVLETLRDEPVHSPRSPVQAYRCLGCSPDCGRCIPTVREILREARAAANAHRSACRVGCPTCPHTQAELPVAAAGGALVSVRIVEVTELVADTARDGEASAATSSESEPVTSHPGPIERRAPRTLVGLAAAE